ncbi:DUF2255 family protein [Promicromonospora sp. NPDC090134]|uniref:DUF2255 family protein n=1 Tax=Promicromonospora sp. NPDC090134 TaxID=3364408 RepID=UPI00381E3656
MGKRAGWLACVTQTSTSSSETARWTPAELAQLCRIDEISVSSRRPDGSLRPGVTVWAVPLDGSVYVRSAYGPENPWFRRARRAGRGRIRAGDLEREVSFELADHTEGFLVDAAYHAKYDRFGPRIVGDVVGEHVHHLTLRLTPAADEH